MIYMGIKPQLFSYSLDPSLIILAEPLRHIHISPIAQKMPQQAPN